MYDAIMKWGLVILVFLVFLVVVWHDSRKMKREEKKLEEDFTSFRERVDEFVAERDALRAKVLNQRAMEIRIMADRLWAPGMSAEEAIACAVVNHAQLSRVEIPEEPDVEGREEDAALDVFSSLSPSSDDAPEEAPADSHDEEAALAVFGGGTEGSGEESASGEQLYFARIVFGEKGIDFHLQGSPMGIKGMVAIDATPSVMLTIAAVDPGQACAIAWEEAIKTMGNRKNMKMCDSVEEFSKHVIEILKNGEADGQG